MDSLATLEADLMSRSVYDYPTAYLITEDAARSDRTFSQEVIECSDGQNEAMCYVVAYESIEPAPIADLDKATFALSSTNNYYTITCGVEVHYLTPGGPLMGALVNTTVVNFHKAHVNKFHLPITFQQASATGTWARGFARWDVLNGPTTNPSIGVKATKSSGVATSYLTGTIETFVVSDGIPVGTQVTTGIGLKIDTAGWSCYR